MKVASLLVAAGLCNGIAYALDGLRGLQGAALGTAVALVMCGVSFVLLGWARRAQGPLILAAMLGSVLASFVILGVTMVLLGLLRQEFLETGTLTALVVYLAYRLVEGFGPRVQGLRAGVESTAGGSR